ncbi:hypothetical protein ACFY7H_19140 [Streptomyces sp. NPDC012794]|uniref:D-alanyl-D-alanine carboxypeptidase n=1 Tax=Streptomyces sp. NPDC012794 TaxID=3364850 RepID=UPI00368927B6
MAGESPDKSVDEGASGEQDPRLSVFQPRDPLKRPAAAAEAAETGPDGQAQDAGAETEAAAPSRPSPGRVDPKTPVTGVVRQAPSREPDSGQADADDAGSGSGSDAGESADESRSESVKPRSASASASAPAEAGPRAERPSGEAGSGSAEPAGAEAEKPSRDPRTAAADSERTAVFRTVKPGSASADAEKDAKPAGKPSGDVRTTAFGVVKPDADAKDAADGKDSDTERTAVFRGVNPGSASADAEKDAKPAGKPSADVRTTAFGVVTKDPAPEAEKPAADTERTAVFRAVKPGSASADAEKDAKPAGKPSGDVRITAFGVVKPNADAKGAEGGKEADSERTAVFRAVRPGSAPADAEKPATPPEDSDSERTAVFRAVKPGSAPADAEKPATGKPAGKPTDKPAGKPTDKPAGKPSGDVRTTAFGVVKPDAGGKGAEKPGTPPAAPGKPSQDPGTAKPGTAKPSSAKPGTESDRRVSTFVPLRGEGESGPAGKPEVGPTPPPPPRLDPSERTTQQPLPPRPPLDMLADLTNNPPPPPTPMRNVIRRVKIYAPIVLLLAIVIAVVQLVRPLPAPTLKLTAKATYTFPGGAPSLPWPTEGQASMAAAGLGTIGSSGEQKPVPIASVTKSMTAYIIMRDHPFKKGEKGAMIDVDKTAEIEGQKDKSDNESTLNTVREGNKISEYDAIAALMIPSANNIARLLARWDSGSQEAFVKKMNDTAKELGMTNTTYTDPSGLDATTVSTAEDQVKLGLKIVEIPALVDITRMPSWTDQTGKTWPNWNRLVPFHDSLGIKTGTTTKAGGNLLFAAQKKVGDTNQLLVGAVLGQHKPPIIDSVIAASRSLLIATQKEVQGAPVVKKGQVVGYVDDGLGGHTPVVATADVQAVGWSSLTVDIKLGDGGTAIPESAKAGTQVGVLTVGDGASQVKVPVALQRALDTPGFGSKLTRIG